MAGVKEFASNLVEDLKSSWRFKLAIVLWIPLVVTTIVALAQFGVMDRAGKANTFATTQLVAESTVNFPMFYIYRGWDGLAYFTSVTCLGPAGQLVPTQACPATYGFGGQAAPRANCTQILAQSIPATPTSRKITCSIVLQQNTFPNPVYQLTVVGADGIPDDMVWINPTQYQSVAFQQVLTMQSESAKMDTSWSADIDYYSSVAATSASSFKMEVRIDDFANILYTNSNTFTDYQFLAAWGGVMFFFYVLFAFVFFIAKLFLPDDSKIIGQSGPAAPEYQTIK